MSVHAGPDRTPSDAGTAPWPRARRAVPGHEAAGDPVLCTAAAGDTSAWVPPVDPPEPDESVAFDAGVPVVEGEGEGALVVGGGVVGCEVGVEVGCAVGLCVGCPVGVDVADGDVLGVLDGAPVGPPPVLPSPWAPVPVLVVDGSELVVVPGSAERVDVEVGASLGGPCAPSGEGWSTKPVARPTAAAPLMMAVPICRLKVSMRSLHLGGSATGWSPKVGHLVP